MTRTSPRTVIPVHKDKYYVYGLFKPNEENPFYIGKGKGNRINHHFQKSKLIKNTPKNSIINKYGDSIRREILCYFSVEEDAYLFEEYLISLYGISGEGGCLVNFAKTRYEYSELFKNKYCKVAYKKRKRKYPEETVYEAIKLFYVNMDTSLSISQITKIPNNYLYYILRGEACPEIYDKFFSEFYMEIGDRKLRLKQDSQFAISHTKCKTSDSEMIDWFNKYCDGVSTFEEISQNTGLGVVAVKEIFLGKSRKYLNLDYSRFMKVSGMRISNHRDNHLEKIENLFTQGMSPVDIVNTLKIGKTTVYRHVRKLRSKTFNDNDNKN